MTCSACFDAPSFCTSCGHPTRIYRAGACICRNGFEASPVTASCGLCGSTRCATCANTATCASCVINRLLQPSSNVCSCVTGSYEAGLTCIRCTAPCLTCMTTGTTCLSCARNYFGPISNVCTPCPNYCKTCSSATQCHVCREGNHRFSRADCACLPGFFATGAALCSQCPALCTACTAANACSGCAVPEYYLAAGSCLRCDSKALRCTGPTAFTQCADLRILPGCLCSPLTYEVGDDCRACHPTCLTCAGPTGTDCRSCEPNHQREYVPANNICQCNMGFYEANVAQCQICHYFCESCTGGGGTSCRSCNPLLNRILVGSSCLCATNTEELQGFLCRLCDPTCRTCFQQSICLTCNQGVYLLKGSCIDFIMPGFYSDPSLVLLPCSTNCLECTSATLCQKCSAGYNLFNAACVEGCPFPQVSESGVCRLCPHFVFGARCVATCQLGFFPNASNICIPCTPECKFFTMYPNFARHFPNGSLRLQLFATVEYDQPNAQKLSASALNSLSSFGVATTIAAPAQVWQDNSTTSSLLFHNIANENLNASLVLGPVQDLFGDSLTSNEIEMPIFQTPFANTRYHKFGLGLSVLSFVLGLLCFAITRSQLRMRVTANFQLVGILLVGHQLALPLREMGLGMRLSGVAYGPEETMNRLGCAGEFYGGYSLIAQDAYAYVFVLAALAILLPLHLWSPFNTYLFFKELALMPLNFMFFYANVSYRNVYCSRPYLQSLDLLLANLTVILTLFSRVMDYNQKEMILNEARLESKQEPGLQSRNSAVLSFVEESKAVLAILLVVYGPEEIRLQLIIFLFAGTAFASLLN